MKASNKVSLRFWVLTVCWGDWQGTWLQSVTGPIYLLRPFSGGTMAPEVALMLPPPYSCAAIFWVPCAGRVQPIIWLGNVRVSCNTISRRSVDVELYFEGEQWSCIMVQCIMWLDRRQALGQQWSPRPSPDYPIHSQYWICRFHWRYPPQSRNAPNVAPRNNLFREFYSLLFKGFDRNVWS